MIQDGFFCLLEEEVLRGVHFFEGNFIGEEVCQILVEKFSKNNCMSFQPPENCYAG